MRRISENLLPLSCLRVRARTPLPLYAIPNDFIKHAVRLLGDLSVLPVPRLALASPLLVFQSQRIPVISRLNPRTLVYSIKHSACDPGLCLFYQTHEST